MYIISITYTANLDLIDNFLQEHISYLEENYKQGHFLLSGRKEPRTGGIILCRANSREKLDLLISKDPFYREQLADYALTKITPTMACQELKFLLAHQI